MRMPVRPFLKSNLPDSALSDKLAWHEKNVYRLINKFHFCLEREGSIVVILTRILYGCNALGFAGRKINPISRV